MSKIIVVGTCLNTKRALYVSDIKPSLMKRDAKGDWGYTFDASKAIGLSVFLADKALRDMNQCCYNAKIISV